MLHCNILDTLAPLISLMVNLSFDTGILPNSLKGDLVHPLLKTILLDMDIFKKYRLIYNLAFVSKVMEKVVVVYI